MKIFVHFGLAFSILFIFSAVAMAQNNSPNRARHDSAKHPLGERLPVETSDLNTPAMKGVELEKKIGRRLPTGYKDVVTNQQRDDIYKVQQDYAQIIERLKVRIQLLERERDQKIDSMLTDEQVNKIKLALGTLAFEKHLMREEGESAPRRGRRSAAQDSDNEADE